MLAIGPFSALALVDALALALIDALALAFILRSALAFILRPRSRVHSVWSTIRTKNSRGGAAAFREPRFLVDAF